MAKARPAEPARLIVGGIGGCPDAWASARKALVQSFGPVELETGPIAFDLTDYYEGQMGAGLSRWLIAFQRSICQHEISEIKRRTNSMEAEIASDCEWPVARPINLDPGYVTLAKLVLASAKDHAHRIAVGEDIYAEVTLRFNGARFEANPWTYADYRQESYLEFFGKVRESLRVELRG